MMSDKISDITKAEILVEALPYIQEYNGEIVVIKYGGNAMVSDKLRASMMADIVLLSMVGMKVVLVHGGGPEITKVLEQMGKESKFVNGLRYTDKETAEVVQMVLAGKINKELVAELSANGGRAAGVSGLDAGMIKAVKKTDSGDLGFVGDIESMDTTIITDLLEKGYIPVVSAIGAGENGEVYNINADAAAASIAAELGAKKFLLLTDVKGLLKDKDDESTLIAEVKVSNVRALKNQGIISGGMIPKVDCCVEAVRRGVKRTTIIDGRVEHAIVIEMLTDEGVGTMFS
ncbi:MAG TPA: acetylglutamate kinase [Clostridiales bacterium]|nr:acetylglutamate kinase [Clostridiales bacterium]HRT82540.1 acetylglutamate kinase [Oscillospiraceae bacterium]